LKLRFYIFAALITILILGSCVPTRYLDENEQLLYKIKLSGVVKSDPNRIASLYQQKPNRKVLGSTPYLSIYYFGKKIFNPEKKQKQIEETRTKIDHQIAVAGNDSSHVNRLLRKRERRLARKTRRMEEGNLLMTLGEPPVIYDTTKAIATRQQISNYLTATGFFQNKVTFTTSEKNKKLTLNFIINENVPYTYSQVNYIISDPVIRHIIDSTRTQSLVRVNQQYNEETLANERNRLELLLKNQGYFEFTKQFITVEPDTSFEKNRVRLGIIIANNNDSLPHRVFRLSQINFNLDAGRERFGLVRDTILLNNIYYLAYEHRISPRILDKKTQIRPGQLYSLHRTIATQQQLTGLDMFRFINISFLPTDSTLTANINGSPSRRFQETTEAGLSYSAGLPGPFANFRLRVRNIFRGAELLEIGLRGAAEGQFSVEDNASVITREMGVNVAFIFPQFLIPFRTNQYFSGFNPRTRLNLNYTNTNRIEFNRINNQLTFDYIWQKSPILQFVFTPFDVTINQTRIKSPNFLESLYVPNSNNELTTYGKSFQDAFVSSMNFSVLYNSNNYNHTLDAAYLRLYLEEAGLVGSMFLKESYNNLHVFEFGRFIADYRRYLKLSRTNFLVSRINFGIARSVRQNDYLPYDKYFYAGGGTSLRAFLPRRLGPGSYFPQQYDSLGVGITNEDGTPKRNIYSEQQGELLIEGNLEYRFHIFNVMNGALFTDVGNIWMLTKDEDRGEDAQFRFNRFYKEFAVGAGLGLRFDFTFLIARIDIASRIYDPTNVVGQRFFPTSSDSGVPGTASERAGYRNMRLNLGIGYPF